MMHYARCKAGNESIRTACQRIIRYRLDTWTTAAIPVTCPDCRSTPFFRERRGARGLEVPASDGPLPVFHPSQPLGARQHGPETHDPEYIAYLGPLLHPDWYAWRGRA